MEPAKPTSQDEASKPKSYEVIAGNIGTVCSSESEAEARAVFASYCESSQDTGSRAAGESVTLLQDGEPIAEFIGSLAQAEDEDEASAEQLRAAVEDEESTLALFEQASQADYNTIAERERCKTLAQDSRARLERLLPKLRAKTLEDEAELEQANKREREEGSLRRGVWRLEEGSFGYHGSGESHYQAREDCKAVQRELQSLAGSRIECADGTYLYCKVDSEDEAEASEHSAAVLEAVLELRTAGFEVCGDYEALPLRWQVSQGIEAQYLRYLTASEDEARACFADYCESVGAGLDCFDSVTLAQDCEDGSRRIVETYTRDEEQASLFEYVQSAGARGEVYEADPEDLVGFADLSYSRLSRETRSKDSRAKAIREGTARFLFVPEHATGSDYGGGGSLYKANLRDLLALCKREDLTSGEDYWTLSGDYGSYGIAFRLGLRCSALVETLQALENYPCIDEETMSEVESEEQDEAWEGYYCSDFRRGLEKREQVELDDTPDEDLFELFLKACNDSNTYWEHDSSGASIRLERVCESITRAQVFALAGCKREDEDEESEARARLALAVPLFEALQATALQSAEEREPCATVEACEAVREALGAPSASAIADCAGTLASIARWPIAEAPQAAQGFHSEAETLEAVRAELAHLRYQVAVTMRAAREQLPALDPARAAREQARGEYAALPRELPK